MELAIINGTYRAETNLTPYLLNSPADQSGSDVIHTNLPDKYTDGMRCTSPNNYDLVVELRLDPSSTEMLLVPPNERSRLACEFCSSFPGSLWKICACARIGIIRTWPSLPANIYTPGLSDWHLSSLARHPESSLFLVVQFTANLDDVSAVWFVVVVNVMFNLTVYVHSSWSLSLSYLSGAC